MTYYYPIGRPATIPTNIDYSLTAVTASAGTVGARGDTASYAETVQITPTSGGPGVDQNLALCTAVIPGPTGPQGATGTQGTSLTVCPPGTKHCTLLVGPAGYPLVCIEIPAGCTSGGTTCPDTLEGFVTTTTTTTTTTIPVTTTTTTSTTTLDT